jgi:photosystem II stability/assembly factor-like uncharacterized protein
MKRKIIALTAFMLLLFFYKANSQEYKRMMNDSNANFYDIQKSFYKYWAEKEKQIKQIKLSRDKEEEDKEGEEEEEGFEGEYYQFKRWEWWMEPRVYPTGKMVNIAAKTFEAWLKEKRESSLNRTSSLGGAWSPAGPYNYQIGASWSPGLGRVNCIAFDPLNTNTMYVGCPAGGIWKTTNGGSIWNPLSDNIPSIGVSGIAINYSNPNQIFILTGDGDFANTYSVGILRSDDGGQNWNTTNFSFGTNMFVRGYKLLMDPSDFTIMFAVTNVGVYRTNDGWVTSTLVLNGDFTDIEFKPGNRNTVYACSRSAFLRSTTNGTAGSWSIMTTAPGSNRLAIGVTLANTNYVYFVAGSSGGFNGLFLSTNSGTSFTMQSNSPNIMSSNPSGIDDQYSSISQSDYDLTIGVDPGNASVVYVGGVNLWKSTNSGINWTAKTTWALPTSPYAYNHADQHAFEFKGSVIYTGTDGGIYSSTDGANSFSSLNATLQITQMYRIAGTPQNSNLFLYGAQDNGTGLLNLSPASNLSIAGADGGQVRIDYTNSNKLYFAAQLGVLYKSTDGGTTRSSFNPPTEGGHGEWVTPYIMSPVSPTTFYAGYDTVYKTTNSGTTWTAVLPGSVLHKAMAMGTNNTNIVYSATPFSLYKTINGGTSWTDITGTVLTSGTYYITSLAVSTINANVVCVSTAGYNVNDKLLYSNDGGVTWMDISGGLLNIQVNCVAFEPGSTIDAIYIGTDLGVYYKNNNLANCVPFKNGLPNVPVSDFYINTAANKIMAATYGRGAWVSDLFPPCPADYTFSGTNNFAGSQIYTASNTITSSVEFLGGTGADVTYQAGTSTTLLPGFEFLSSGGVVFTVGTDGCSATGRVAGPTSNDNNSDVIIYQTKIPSSLQEKTNAAVIPLEIISSNSAGSSTVINYHLPSDAITAQIEIADHNKKMIRQINLYPKDDGKITLQIGTLTPGNYSYSLVVNGKLIATQTVSISK